MMRTLGKLVGAVLVLFVIYVAWSLWRDHNAKESAAAFCARFAVGSPMADVARAAQGEGDTRHRRIKENEIMVVYIGALPFSRHLCTVTGQGGKVTSVGVAHLD
jgi:uncharacterized membrane protein YccC